MTATRYHTTAPKPRQVVYYLLDASGVPIYVGRSRDVARRLKEHNRHAGQPDHVIHGSKSTWFFNVRSVSMVGPMPWARAVEFERREIERLSPVGNIAHTRRGWWINLDREGATV